MAAFVIIFRRNKRGGVENFARRLDSAVCSKTPGVFYAIPAKISRFLFITSQLNLFSSSQLRSPPSPHSSQHCQYSDLKFVAFSCIIQPFFSIIISFSSTASDEKRLRSSQFVLRNLFTTAERREAYELACENRHGVAWKSLFMSFPLSS